MSHERTVEQMVDEIEHLTGVRLRIGWVPFRGLYLEDRETGNQFPLGASSKKTILLSAEQESICRSLYREHWIVLLGLGAPQDEED